MEREERSRFVAVDPATYCSPRSATSNNCGPLSVSRVEQGLGGHIDRVRTFLVITSTGFIGGPGFESRDTKPCCHCDGFALRGDQLVGPVRIDQIAGYIAGHRREGGTGRLKLVDVVSGPVPDFYLETKMVYPPHPLGDGSSVKIISAQTARVNSAVIAPNLASSGNHR